MVRLFGLFILTLFFGFSEANAVAVSKEQVKSMSFNKLQKVRYAYIEFMLKVDQDQVLGNIPETKKKTSYFKVFWKDLLIANAFAVAPDGSMCFFGGWPSRMSGGKCSTPWKNKNDEDVQRLGAYDSNAVCGSNTKFRCNPTLFGSPANDGKGICIDTDGTYNHLTEKCERASRALVPQVIESYQIDPTAISDLSLEIKNFCDSFENYDSCDDLARRIKEITGEDLGTYSGSGVNPDEAASSPRAGGRTRNVDVQGEHLRPGADFPAGAPTTGAQVLDRCQNLMNERSDTRNRNILSFMSTEECSPEISNTFSALGDFERIADNINHREAVSGVNAKAFEQNILAMLSNEIRFGSSELILLDPDELFNKLVEDHPHLKNDPRYKEAFDRAYGHLDREAKAGRLYPFEPESTRQQFNNLSSMVNEACSKIRDQYVEKFGNPGLLSRFMNNDEHTAFFNEQAAGVHAEIDVLLSESVAGHLLSTDYFKRNVFDPSDEFVEECARNPSYQVIKQPIAASTLRTGHNQVMSMMQENLSKINSRQRDLNTGNRVKADGILAEYLKTDAGIVNMSMDDLDSNKQYRLGILVCSETNKILNSDRNWRYVDMAVGGVGMAAGVVLMATGVGSPLGVALTAASLGVAGYAGGRAVGDYRDASSRQRATDITLAQRRQRMEEYLNQSEAARNGKKDALIQGGLSALVAFPAVRILRAGAPAARSGTAALAGRTSRQALPTGGTPRAALGSGGGTPPPRPALGSGSGGPPRVRGPASGSQASQQASQAARNSRPWSALTRAEKVMVRNEAVQFVSTSGGGSLPSAVVGSRNIAQLSLREAETMLAQIGKTTGNKSAYRKMAGLLHPDRHISRSQALRDLMGEEFKVLGNLREHIIKLGGNFN